MKLPYREGTVFLVPLRNGGYARGVVARMSAKGKVLFGYFFGPRHSSREVTPLDDLDPVSAVRRMMFGDLGLINGEWPICGTVPSWNRSLWPMPDFMRKDEVSERAWLVRRSDNDPSIIDEEYPTDYDSTLAPDSLYGYGAVELVLTKLLGQQQGQHDGYTQHERQEHSSANSTKSYPFTHYLYFSDKIAAKGVAEILRAQGFVVEDRLGGDDVNWLVLANHVTIPSETAIEEASQVLRHLAEANGGEYDGWEAETTE